MLYNDGTASQWRSTLYNTRVVDPKSGVQENCSPSTLYRDGAYVG